MADWVKFHREITQGSKRGIPRAIRFVLMELSLACRPLRGRVELPVGMTDVDGVHDLVGGKRREVVDAIQVFTTDGTSKRPPSVVIMGPSGARLLTMPRWRAMQQPPWSRLAYAAVYQRDGYACRYCRSTVDLTIDHVVPRALLGGDTEDNLVVACRACNARKGKKTPEQAGMVLLPIEEAAR